MLFLKTGLTKIRKLDCLWPLKSQRRPPKNCLTTKEERSAARFFLFRSRTIQFPLRFAYRLDFFCGPPRGYLFASRQKSKIYQNAVNPVFISPSTNHIEPNKLKNSVLQPSKFIFPNSPKMTNMAKFAPNIVLTRITH